jgi:hypothetical protein
MYSQSESNVHMISNVRAHHCAHSCDDGDVLPSGVADLGWSSRLRPRASALKLAGAARNSTAIRHRSHHGSQFLTCAPRWKLRSQVALIYFQYPNLSIIMSLSSSNCLVRFFRIFYDLCEFCLMICWLISAK